MTTLELDGPITSKTKHPVREAKRRVGGDFGHRYPMGNSGAKGPMYFEDPSQCADSFRNLIRLEPEEHLVVGDGISQKAAAARRGTEHTRLHWQPEVNAQRVE